MTYAGGWWRGLRRIAKPLKDPRFWIIQAAVVAIAVVHNTLEFTPRLPSDLLDVLPVSLLWIPLLFAAIGFGLAGASATSVIAALSSVPNWMLMQRAGTLPQELFLVVIAIGVSLLVGFQTDRRLEAQRNAEAYAAYSVRDQEEERRRLSLDLHDDPIQTLVSVCHDLDGLISVQSPDQSELVDIRSTVASVIHKLRDIGAALRPPMLDDLGLVSALRGMVAEYNKRGSSEASITVSGQERRLPADAELALFRICQESFRNAARHAEATHVRTSIYFGGSQVTLIVEDDGKGFDKPVTSAVNDGHWGLLGMKERAEMMGGKFGLSSRPGKGTRITVHLPVPPPQV